MGVLERRQREKEVLRGRILEVAGELFVAQGYQSVSIRKIAERIEYAPSTIYLYFKDKSELLGTICIDTFEKLIELMEEINADDRISPEDSIRQGVRTYIEFGLAHPHHYLITFCLPHTEDMASDSQSFREHKDLGLRCFDLLRQCMLRAREAGVVRGGDLEVLCQTVWMFMHGVTNLLITSKCEPDFPWVNQQDTIESAIEMILRGVRP